MVEELQIIEAYKCAHCNRIFTDEGKATEHIQIPADNPLPAGFIYTGQDLEYHYLVIPNKPLRIVSGEPFCGDGPVHGIDYWATLIKKGSLELETFGLAGYGGRSINSKEVRERFSVGYNWLLSEKEFRKVSRRWDRNKRWRDRHGWKLGSPWDDQLVRSTPELEQLIETTLVA